MSGFRMREALNPSSPIPGPTPAVSYRKYYDFRREFLVDQAERKLPQDILSEVVEVNWPTLRRFPDSRYGFFEGGLKVDRRNEAAFPIPR